MPAVVTTDDVRRMALEVEALLLDRRAATSDPAEKEVLRAELRKTRDDIDDLTVDSALALAERLNALSDRLRAANAAVRDAPFDGIAARMQSTFDRLQDSVGDVAATIRGGSADDSAPTASAPLPAPPAAPAAPTPGKASARAAASNGRDEYADLFKSCEINSERLADTQRIVDRIVENAGLYEDVARSISGTLPWFVVGIIHSLEASLSLRRHLHNGDPLTGRTEQEPPGRPLTGMPPFSWKESARDALLLKKLDRVSDWTLPALLERVELYNGAGYRNRGMNSPYLWSFSQHWTKGKFVKDHVFDPEAPSSQCGAAVLLRDMVNRGVAKVEGAEGAVAAEAALGHRSAALVGASVNQPPHVQKEIAFPGNVSMGSKDAKAVSRVQEWCSFHRVATPIDGEFGAGTRDAVKAFQSATGLPSDGTVDQRTWSALIAPMLRALVPLSQAAATLNDAVVAVGNQHVTEHPIELGGDNMGAWVRLYMKGLEGKEQQWCAGFLCFVVEQAARGRGEKMPFPRQVGVAALIADAKASGRFIAGKDLKTPVARLSRLRPGCVFVIKTDSTSHAGLVAAVGDDTFQTIEGNTNQAGGSRGFEAIVNRRNYVDKDFILLA